MLVAAPEKHCQVEQAGLPMADCPQVLPCSSSCQTINERLEILRAYKSTHSVTTAAGNTMQHSYNTDDSARASSAKDLPGPEGLDADCALLVPSVQIDKLPAIVG